MGRLGAARDAAGVHGGGEEAEVEAHRRAFGRGECVEHRGAVSGRRRQRLGGPGRARAVQWRAAALVWLGALFGGHGGAHLGRRAPARLVRGGTVALAYALTALFFLRAYG